MSILRPRNVRALERQLVAAGISQLLVGLILSVFLTSTVGTVEGILMMGFMLLAGTIWGLGASILKGIRMLAEENGGAKASLEPRAAPGGEKGQAA